ncbi:hypothetical protein FHY17_001203 [Xanthomonas arboricola]|uniref:hypothetical protein n=1 Tax=Xanthomonas TaxID=338 RepID=UPI0016229A88|nr:hypothetical protein [Xanthomonas arboricola]MBB3796975.1 hypothetical protein [Xanthomonas arboricola]
MLMSVHSEALYELLIKNPVTSFNSPFANSMLTVSEKILDEYDSKFTDPTEKNIYQAFITAMHSRLKYTSASTPLPGLCINGDYVHAGRVGGRYLVLSQNQQLSTLSLASLDSYAVRSGAFPNVFEKTAQPGFSPFEIHKLKHNTKNPPSSISRFFSAEERVTIYDKHINTDSLSLINYLIKHCSHSCSVNIITSARASSMSLSEIVQGTNLNGNQTLRVCIAAQSSISRIHDRHIFVGENTELHFPRGLDCYGKSPSWTNKSAVVHIHEASKGQVVSIEIQSSSSGSRSPIRVRSCVIG